MSAASRFGSRLTWRLAWRYYSRGGSGGGQLFGAGLARLAVVGLMVSVALLVVVLAVMNGFERELRERILSFVPHVEITYPYGEPQAADRARLASDPAVRDVAPFSRSQGLLYVGGHSRAVELLGLDSQQLPAGWAALLREPQALAAGNLALSQTLADQLGIAVGDKLTVLSSDPQSGSRVEVRTLAGVFATHTELDQQLAVVALATSGAAQRGWQLQLDDPLASRDWAAAVAASLSPGARLGDWRQSHGNLYQAIKLSRQLVVLLILLTVAIAAFNVVAMLVMSVERRRGDIAILQTMGLQRADVVALFGQLAMVIGVVGVGSGVLLGLALCVGVGPAFTGLQSALGWQILSTEVYPIDYLPVDLRGTDLVLIAAVTLALTAAAALYPARRASALLPAAELRSE